MNYPKMLYKGEAKYIDNEQLRNDLFSKELKTIIVADPEQEQMRREHGYVDLADLMYKPKHKTAPLDVSPEKETEEQTFVKPKRKYTRKVQNVGHDAA